VPTRGSWLRLLSTPSSYLLVLALVATAAAKARVLRTNENVELWPGRWIAAIAPDLAVFLGIAAVLALCERATRRALFVTLPIAIAVTFIASISALQLWITGEQLSAQVLVLALDRFTDVRAMARASVDVGVGSVVLLLCVVAMPPVVAGWRLRRSGRSIALTSDGGERARAAAAVTLVALVLMVVTPVPDQLVGLYRNAVARTAWGLAFEDRATGGLGLFRGYEPHDLVAPDAIARLRSGPHPNVIVIVLESSRRDATTLADPQARAQTPNLVALAARGIEVTHARAVIPHTTKSLWSMFCARLPILQPKLYETTAVTDAQCLPHILAAAGWRTGFLQSAVGRFDDRPRLAHRLGFREFVAAEQYTTEIAGYLATDDEALVEQLRTWLDKAATPTPFMVTLLTSATHHPYLLTEASAARAKAAGRPTETDRERYDRQIEAADHMIGDVLELLRQRGVLDNTIVVAIGDHGEGFGDKAARQHMLNFYEEGLRVPWVIAGPAVPKLRIDANASLVDLAPTLLDLLGVQLSAEATTGTHARSALRIDGERVLPFSCFFVESCYGFVRGTTKVVSMRETDRSFAFDLARDPDERNPVSLGPELRGVLDDVTRTIDRHRTSGKPVYQDPLVDFFPWNCPVGQRCGIKL
jgi:lipoteichoic acid synthase